MQMAADMSEPLREKVARGLAESAVDEAPWEDRTDREQRLWLTDADRAIAAVFDHIEEPTQEMITAGAAMPAMRNQWRAMIASARKAAEEQT